eukprot:CAMPEP_0175040592 /NCGR_PEP_ID=MMETSP0052_2-20121109/1364_1 /TAXON_ID=51329 ORGANISM="Polytomella parva, Strain SAG 63-3" /NCGR_SAMPLE_ID=MMETSP0052_2 /ASSEMBLY_ACC=CAM_ASM_000194 /LENGTH=428 /DNA_ID=CAMNT_0016302851 /DNA_START=133 /DNA_END=1416 /DNA_ORIENTATION=-
MNPSQLATIKQADLVAGQANANKNIDSKFQLAIKKRSLDYTAPYLNMIQSRLSHPSRCSLHLPSPIFANSLNILPPCAYPLQPATSICTKHVPAPLQRSRAKVNALLWAPHGRHVVAGESNGKFILFDGDTMDSDERGSRKIHDKAITSLTYLHNEMLLLSADEAGYVRLSKDNLDPHATFVHPQEKKCTSVSAAPTDMKFASGSTDCVVRIFDVFFPDAEPYKMNGHGGDVKGVAWHPRESLIASCSKDATVKLWDPRCNPTTNTAPSGDGSAASAASSSKATRGPCVATLAGARNEVHRIGWSNSGRWLLSSSKDQMLRLYDIRRCGAEPVREFRGHSGDVTALAWHPQQEEVFASGGMDGMISFWHAGSDQPMASMANAHKVEEDRSKVWDTRSITWALAWHPLGHTMASAGSDKRVKFWCRKRP